MKVIIVAMEPFPNGMAATSRIKCYAKGLISQGVDCEVLLAHRSEVYGKKPNNLMGEGTYEGIPFKYIGGTPLRASNVFARRLFDYLDYWNTCKYVKENAHVGDAVLCYMREAKLSIQLAKICKKTGVKCVRDLCELPFGTSSENKNTPRKRERYMGNDFPEFDGAIAISEALLDYANKYKRADAKLVKIPIMVNTKVGLPERQKTDIPYIFHSGTLYEQKDGILGATEAFGIAKQRLGFPVKYLFTGILDKSPVKESILAIMDKYQLHDSMEFLGFLSNEDLLQYQVNCSMMIINKHENNQNRYCFATKLGEYLLSGRPVITTDVGEAMNYLKDGENAFIVKDNDVIAMADKIEYVFENVEQCNLVGLRGRELAINEFSYEKQGTVLRKYLESL